MKILVTGAAGRIGKAVCRCLSEGGFDVKATDLKFDRGLPVRVDVADVLDREACYRLIEGVETVVHLANHPGPSYSDAQKVFNENVAMNMNVFQAAAELGVSRIVFASSIQAISGHRYYPEEEQAPSGLSYLPLDGDHPPNPGNTYALSKVVTETMLKYYVKIHGMRGVAIRFPSVLERKWLREIWERSARERRGYGPLDEGFSYLTFEDAAELVKAILLTPLDGFRVYQPAALSPCVDMPVREIVDRFYSNVPLRKPVAELQGLVDVSTITQETGWTPRDNMRTA